MGKVVTWTESTPTGRWASEACHLGFTNDVGRPTLTVGGAIP